MERLSVSTELQIFGLTGFATLAKLTTHRAGLSEQEGKPADAAAYRRDAEALHGKYLDLLAGGPMRSAHRLPRDDGLCRPPWPAWMTPAGLRRWGRSSSLPAPRTSG